MQENQTVLSAPLRATIRLGSHELFAFQTTNCPECKQRLRLVWPSSVIHIPLHRVISLNCPLCRHDFSFVAFDLVSFVSGVEHLTSVVVKHLS
jgi:hypothetical protein